MELQEAVNVLEHHKMWRKGEDVEMSDPKKLNLAIDIAIRELKINNLRK